MKKLLGFYPVGCLCLVTLSVVASCTNEKKTEPKAPAAQATDAKGTPTAGAAQAPDAAGSSSVSFTPGEAGGTIEETITASATVSALDAASRKITLKNQDGTEATFTAPASMQNFDQVHVGDIVTATVNSKLVVFVDRNSKPDVTQAAAVARAPKGAKPGAIVAEGFELVASVKSIDMATHRATLEFADGQTKVVTARPDVDLSKYKAGDSVVIQAFQQLMVVVESK